MRKSSLPTDRPSLRVPSASAHCEAPRTVVKCPAAPDTPRMDARQILRNALGEAASTAEAFLADETNLQAVERFVDAASDTLEGGGRIFACGNGGSMSDAMHFVEELVGCFRKPRQALPAMAFSDPATLTCIANDFGFEAVFSRQLEAHGRPGDLLLLLSTSGESPNVLAAARVARRIGVRSVALLGRGGGKLATEVEIPIVVPKAVHSDRIQELHLQILHAAIESIEQRLTTRDERA